MDEVVVRRLIGAGLLLAVAFLVSLVLPEPSGEPRPEPGMQVVEVDMNDPGAVITPAPVEPPAQPQRGLLTEPEVSTDVPAGTASSGDADAQTGEPPAAAAPPAPKPEAAPAAPKPAVTGPQTGRPAPAPEAVEPAAEPAKPEPATGTARWAVQAGSYADIANARQVEAQLKALGYPTSISLTDTAGGTRYRVRSGPFATRAQADAARRRIEQARILASVVPDG